jgi:hypothetical protein
MTTPSKMDLRHLRREAATALELALVALAPQPLLDGLAIAAGTLNALAELPLDTEPLRLKAESTLARAERVLAEWREWVEARKATA